MFSCWISRFQVKQIVLHNWWLDDSSQLKSLREKAEKKEFCFQIAFRVSSTALTPAGFPAYWPAPHISDLLAPLVLKSSSKSPPSPINGISTLINGKKRSFIVATLSHNHTTESGIDLKPCSTTVWLWTCYWTSLSLRFLNFKVGILRTLRASQVA